MGSIQIIFSEVAESWFFGQHLVREILYGLGSFESIHSKKEADGSFMDKTFVRFTQILDKMAEHNQAWHSEDTTCGIEYGPPFLTNMIKENQERDQVIAGIATNINVLTKMFTESQTKKVNVVEDVHTLSNEDCEEANYVNNSKGGYQRQDYHGPGQQNQWRSNPQGQGHQQWRNDLGSSNQGENEQMFEVEDLGKGVEAQVEVPIVVEVEKFPREVEVQEVNREKAKEKVKEAQKALAPFPRPSPPFSQRFARRVDDSKFEKFYDILKQLSVNIPFVEAFQEMSGFVKYLKYLITKKKITKNEVVHVTHRVSSIIATTVVQKKEDPGAFTIPCDSAETSLNPPSDSAAPAAPSLHDTPSALAASTSNPKPTTTQSPAALLAL
nr:uncharacterized protein LOC104088741 [Nicotiana tomentosiformis]